MKRCIIIAGAEIKNYERLRCKAGEDDFAIYCDSGLRHLEKLEIKPNLIIGDFDSHEKPETAVETIVLPRAKDDTDTLFGVKEAVKRGFTDFLILGAVGQRLDHTLGNISALFLLDSLKLKGRIIDDYSEIEVVSTQKAFIGDSFSYFSLLSMDGKATGVNVKNAKFPLENAEIGSDDPYGISNEVLSGMTAEVSVKHGRLLLIKMY